MRSDLARRTADLRRDLRAAIKAGEIVGWPQGAKVSVRSETASLYSAITIEIVDAPQGWAFGPDRQITPEAAAVDTILEGWLDEYVDGAWGHVRVDSATIGGVSRTGWIPGND